MTADKFEVRITNGGEVPTLSFREDAHLSWFRGYGFQVSGSEEGIGDYGSSSRSMQEDLRLASSYGLHGDKAKLLNQLIVLSHVFEASREYPDLWNILYSDSSLLDHLIEETGEVDSNIKAEGFNLHELLGVMYNDNSLEDANEDQKYYLQAGYKSTDTLGTIVYLTEDVIAMKNVHSDTWYRLDIKNLFGVDLESPELKQLISRLLFVLQCKCGIYFTDLRNRGSFRNVDGTDFIGVDPKGKEMISAERLPLLIVGGGFMSRTKLTNPSNIFGEK